ncbi:hypothetical protein [Sphingobacterium psychroaquaticum]|uniref:Uncharacterized protein n=1 Tax=Sphingobacterium psychroaquaticum TaxID=561061 RepID=A0A1X7JSM3_9SPHI|nr:hypothetical protein [Sphingobacterium psychroaquaticum]QBQ41147.1 hypothetical protein E2P86_08255 [Sphingobacterium psychroaquaticum]SMG31396.1 hypothetical protein SAMN05660862_2173 [Sphingobacterium psychroaquaticum]
MRILFTLAVVSCVACQPSEPAVNQNTLTGSYRLLESTTIKGKDTLFNKVDTTKTEMIKMFNESHFSFTNHDRSKGVDSTALFVSGAGRYFRDGDKYTELLDFCSYRPWEGKQFEFTLEIKGDTLVQHGVEEIPELGVKQHITEKYIKLR